MQANLQQLEQALGSKYLSNDLVPQIQYIKSQTELLQSIKQTIQKRKYYSTQILYVNGNTSGFGNSLLDEDTSSSLFADGIIGGRDGTLDDDMFAKSKFTEEVEKSAISGALRDVQSKCTAQTYEIVKQSLLSNKIKQNQSLEKVTAKLIEERDQLASQLLIIKLQKTNLQKQIQKYKKIAAGIEQQKRNIKKKVDYILKKQNQVFKLQSSFAFKQKISLQLKKRYQRYANSYVTNQVKIQKMYEQLDKLWIEICKKIQQNQQCTGECWRKDIMKKAKEQLIQQRKLIKQQSSHLERQYAVMNIVSEQFKKIFQEADKNEKSQLENSQSVIGCGNEQNSSKSISSIQNKENKQKNQ